MLFIYLSEAALNIIRAALVITAGIRLLQQTQSLLLFGLAMSFEVISSLISPLFLGKMIDCYHPIRIYKWLVVAMFAVVFMLFLGQSVLSETISVFLVYATVSFFAPLQRLAQQSYFAVIRSNTHLRKTNSKHQMAVQIGQVIGIIMAAYVVDHLAFSTIHGVFVVVLLAGSFFALRMGGLDVDNKKSPSQSFISIIRSLSTWVRWLLIVSTFDYLIIALLSLTLPLVVLDALQPGRMMSVLDLSYAIMAIVVSYAAAKSHSINNTLSLCVLAYVILPLAVGLLVCGESIGVHILAVAGIGCAITLSTIGFNSYIQSVIPKPIIGRVLAIRRVCLAILLVIVINSLSWVQSWDIHYYYGALIGLVICMAVIVLSLIKVVIPKMKPPATPS